MSTSPAAAIDPAVELRMRAFARWRVLVYLLLLMLAVGLIAIAPRFDSAAPGPQAAQTTP